MNDLELLYDIIVTRWPKYSPCFDIRNLDKCFDIDVELDCPDVPEGPCCPFGTFPWPFLGCCCGETEFNLIKLL